MRYVLITLLALSASFYASTAKAVVIDNFLTPQTFLILSPPTTPPGFNDSVIGPATNILGTERDVRFDVVGTSTTIPLIAGGFLSAPSGAGNTMTITLQWDGTVDGVTTKYLIDPIGLPFTDLTDGGPSDSIAAYVVNGSQDVTATFTVWADGGIPSTNEITIDDGHNGMVYFSFSDFLTPVDFTQVTALQLELQIPQNGQITLSLLQTVDFVPMAPEPNMLAMLAPLLAGLNWKRRRALRSKAVA